VGYGPGTEPGPAPLLGIPLGEPYGGSEALTMPPVAGKVMVTGTPEMVMVSQRMELEGLPDMAGLVPYTAGIDPD